MQAYFNVHTNLPERFNVSIARTLFKPALLLGFLLAAFAGQLKAQCPCTPNPAYTVGTGSPSGISTLSVARGTFIGIETPGDACIKIMGRFYVDAGETWTLGPTSNMFAYVYLEDASSCIFVENGGILDATETVFQPCAYPAGSWLGTYVLSGGKVKTRKSNFLNASHACISVEPNSFFDLQDSKFVTSNKGLKIVGQQTPADHTVLNNEFYNCTFGIYMSNAIDVNILSNFHRNTSTAFETGIHLESICRNIQVSGGHFLNLGRGVSSIKTVNLDLSQVFFDACDNGVWSMEGTGKLWIKDCLFRETEQIGIDVNYHQPLDNTTANLVIEDNTFALHGAQHNITLKDISASGNCVVKDNVIDLPFSGASLTPPSTTQYGIQVNKFYATGGLSIQHNTLTEDNAGSPGPGGIFVQTVVTAVSSVSIDDNTIKNTASTGSMPTHIRTLDCRAPLAITYNTTDGGTPISGRGISIENCPGAIQLCCNNLTKSYSGLYITGPLNIAQIHTTIFGNHPFAALHYDQVAATGTPQVNHGNNWIGASGMWDAYSNGNPGLAGNYVVSNVNMPNLLTKVFGPPGWFTINGATEPTCGTSTCGGTGGGEPGGKDRSENQDESGMHEQAFTAVVYPNPADQTFRIEFPATEGETQIFLRDATGRVMEQKRAPAGADYAQFSTAALPTALYFLEVTQTGRPSLRSKVVVNHR